MTLGTSTSSSRSSSTSSTTTTGVRQRILSLRHASLSSSSSPLSLWSPRQGDTGTTTTTKTNKDDQRVPVHRFYLIADRKRWEGPKAVVWLVRKLTGGTDPVADASMSLSSQSFHPSETRAMTQVSIVPQTAPFTPKNDLLSSSLTPPPPPPSSFTTPTMPVQTTTTTTTTTHTDTMMMHGFQIDIDCSVQVEFPKILLRLLPSSRSKVEEQGTRAVHEALLKDATLALVAVQRA